MRKKYLTDYMLDNKLKIEFNKVNTINAPCGSGKTTFIFSKKGVIHNLNKFIESENVNFKNVLYVTDTSMLKDKVLNKYNNITKQIRTKDFFSDISKPGITVVTYAQLGSILSNPDFKEVLLNHYNLIIFDEFHNLFNYNNKFQKQEHTYKNIIHSIELIANKSILICLTATPYYVNKTLESHGILENKIIKNTDELISYDEKVIYKEIYPINWIKSYLFLRSKLAYKQEEKLLLYTSNISVMQKYKILFEMYGLKVGLLWSINSNIPLANEQIELRDKLIKNGKLPDDMDILIINAAYETGWDLDDIRVQTVIVDSNNPTVQKQVRNRCRHNIKNLVIRVKEVKRHIYLDEYNLEIEYDTLSIAGDKKFYYDYVKDETSEYSCCDPIRLQLLMDNIDEKYLDTKLNTDTKNEVTLRYAYNLGYKEVKFPMFEKQLNTLSKKYKVVKENGTYIKDKNYQTGKKVERRNDENMNLVIDWLENKWDKVRIPVTEVRDILDLGRRTYDKILKDQEFKEWLKENNIEMTKIKGYGRTIYFKIP